MKIGTLDILRRYPVKSMSGEDLARAHVAYAGMAGDRVFAFVNDAKALAKDNFPWHSAREQHDMLLYQPRFIRELPIETQFPEADAFQIEVKTPSGKTLRVDDPELKREIEERASYPVSLRFSERGMQDSRPVSIFGLQTLAALGGEAGRELDARRFRANFYMRWDDPTPFFEDSLIGKRLKVGERLEIEIVRKDPRCIIINLDPNDAAHHPEVLRTVAKKHRGCVGVYAAVLREGAVSPGDIVTLLP